MLTDRQQLAQQIARALEDFGANVVSPLPLAEHSKLRFHIPDSGRNKVLEKLSSWNWGLPRFVGTTVHFSVRDYAAGLCSVYELDLPRERPPIPNERGGQEIPREVTEFRKNMGLK
jgi:hypothetical protein